MTDEQDRFRTRFTEPVGSTGVGDFASSVVEHTARARARVEGLGS